MLEVNRNPKKSLISTSVATHYTHYSPNNSHCSPEILLITRFASQTTRALFHPQCHYQNRVSNKAQKKSKHRNINPIHNCRYESSKSTGAAFTHIHLPRDTQFLFVIIHPSNPTHHLSPLPQASWLSSTPSQNVRYEYVSL